MNKNKGFTLIELLVVIAIIGILSSVVLASLNTARAKGTDAAIKSDLTNTRAQAALFYDSTSTPTYVAVCTTATTGIVAGVAAAAAAGGTGTTVVTSGALQTTSTTNCFSNASNYAASSPLKSATGYFCVDSNGAAMTTASPLALNAVTCS